MHFDDDLLHGERIRLARLQESDVETLADWFGNDFEMLRLLGPVAMYPFSLADEQAWYESKINASDEYYFTVRTLDDDTLIGSVELVAPDWVNRSAIVGITIGARDYRGKGFGTEAMRLMLRYGFLELNLHRIMLEVFGYNTPAIRSYEKVGFVHEGTYRDKILRDGSYHDIWVMSILRREWVTRYASHLLGDEYSG